MSVATKSVKGRRAVEFQSLDDVSADLDGLQGKRLKTLGNWSVGQILGHLAVVMNNSIDGTSFRAPWYMRSMARLMKSQILNHPSPPGFKLPKAAEAMLVPGPTSDEDGFAAVRKALHRLNTEAKRSPHPALGTLTNEEWTRLHCRHCALHLSFIVPES